jgi:hypothetical protein
LKRANCLAGSHCVKAPSGIEAAGASENGFAKRLVGLAMMLDRSASLAVLPRAVLRAKVAAAGLALSISVITASEGWSQTTPPAKPLSPQGVPDQPPPQAPATREENPGLLNEMGKMLEKSLSILPPLKSPTEAIDDLNARAKDAAKDAGEGLSRLAKPSSMVTGRVICPVANGAANCKVAADKLCQSKGFKEGKSLNADSTEACSAKVLIPGRTRKPDDCRTDYYVTRALCQ